MKRPFVFRRARVFIAAALLVPVMSLTAHGLEPDSISAESAILIEASRGDVIFEKNGGRRMPMASTTKIMTALLALEYAAASGELDSVVTIAKEAVGVEGSSIYLHQGEPLTLRQLVYAVMLESANDAAAAIACEISGSVDGFAELMNERAAALGLDDTHFTNPHGLDSPEHYTTAYDLALLAAAALKNPEFRAVVSTGRTTIPLDGDSGTRVLQNHNKLLKYYPDAVGVKTGYTKKSGRCLVSAAERDGVTLVAVTLNAPDDWNDHISMLDSGFSQYERRSLAAAGDFSAEVPVVGGTADTVAAVNLDECGVVVRRDAPQITAVVELKRFYAAPVTEGDTLGRVVYTMNGEYVAELPLYASADVAKTEKPTLLSKIGKFIEKITNRTETALPPGERP